MQGAPHACAPQARTLRAARVAGAAQFGKTCLLRTTFSFSWNWFSSRPVDMPVFNAVLCTLPPEGA